MNNCMFIGRLTRDAELKTVTVKGESRAVANFTIAVDEGWGDNKKTIFVRCAIWGKRGEALAKYLTKGSMVAATGSISVRAYLTKDGEPRGELELIVDSDKFKLLGGGQRAEQTEQAPDYDAPAPAATKKAKAQAVEVAEDSLPF